MKRILILPSAVLTVLVLCALIVFFGNRVTGKSLTSFAAPALAQDAGAAKAVFVVHCYDEGKTALEGMKGVKKVDKGFRHFREINTVYYDPAEITIPEMEEALKKAGTYTETVRE
jgi:copper chaperone CopZ